MSEQEINWWGIFPVDKEGRPTSHIAYQLIKKLFDYHNQEVDLEKYAHSSCIEENLLEIICNQLEIIDIVKKTGDGKYRYNLNCRYHKFQAKVEKALLEFYADCVPFYPGGQLLHF